MTSWIFQGLKFPYWVAYIAWLLVVVGSFLSAFFVMLFSMQWGKQKSEEWVTTFLMSFIESVFCLDPIKVRKNGDKVYFWICDSSFLHIQMVLPRIAFVLSNKVLLSLQNPIHE